MADEELKATLYEVPELYEIGNADDLILGSSKGNRADADRTGLEYAC